MPICARALGVGSLRLRMSRETAERRPCRSAVQEVKGGAFWR